MKILFLTIIISLKSMMISAQNISSATVIYSGDLTTCRMYDIVPEMFDKGNYGEYVVTVKDTMQSGWTFCITLLLMGITCTQNLAN